MSVETEKIKERFQALYPKINLSKTRIDAIAARLSQKPVDNATDEEVDAVINDANDIISFADIAKNDDKLRNLESKVKVNIIPPVVEEGKVSTDAPEWFKQFAQIVEKKIGGITSEFSEYKKGMVTDQKVATAASLFEKSDFLGKMNADVKKRWIERVNPESDQTVAEQVAELETEYKGLVQATANDKRYSGQPPATKGDAGKKSDEEYKNLAKSILR